VARPEQLEFTPARRPRHETLRGTRVRLEPLDPDRHAADLFAAAQGEGADPLVWRYLGYGPFADVAELHAWLGDHAASEDPLFLAVVDKATGRAGGVVSFLRIAPGDGVIEIGHIWFGGRLQRTPLVTEAIYLLAREAFDELGNRRLEWKCDAANARSRRAAERFGFAYEGTFRQHMVVKGANRDTAWFALLDGDWPAARAAFEAWLAPENFDADGRQRTRLAARQAPVVREIG
jgi:RimJ/RimL family protein N-acetyltransferase